MEQNGSNTGKVAQDAHRLHHAHLHAILCMLIEPVQRFTRCRVPLGGHCRVYSRQRAVHGFQLTQLQEVVSSGKIEVRL